MKKKYLDHHFKNYGFFQVNFEGNELQPVRDEINRIIESNFTLTEEANQYLVGQIENEYNLVDCKNYLQQLILPYCAAYDETYNYIGNCHYVLSHNSPIIIGPLWVNFQKKFEFNPVHHHNGIFSFVIWIDIPYSIENEKKISLASKSKTQVPGCFQFYYTDSLGKISSHHIPADEKYNNCMLLFPSSLSHAVHPFYTSDNFRISISGNFIFETIDKGL